MDNLELRILNVDDKDAYDIFVAEMLKTDGTITPSNAEMHEGEDSFQQWLERAAKNSRGEDLKDGRVPSTTFYLFRENEPKILGAIDVRHEDNEMILKKFGHIGYGIAPSERRKGYATEMLQMALEFCKTLEIDKVLVCCHKDNLGSAHTIINNGGVLESELVEDNNEITQRYWIALN